MECHFNVHGCELVSHVSEHIWQRDLPAVVSIANAAVNLLVHAELVLSAWNCAGCNLVLVLQYLSVEIATDD